MVDPADLIDRIMSCPRGQAGWRQFEDVCVEALTHLFVPPLRSPRRQVATLTGTSRRDATFANRIDAGPSHWARFYRELDARFLIVDFKNYDDSEITGEDVDQLRNYLSSTTSRLGALVCSKPPALSAHIRRNTAFTQEQKIILFITKEELKEMISIKEQGEDPADLLADMVEAFRLQHE
jgi:hypothetical protein